MEALEGLQKIAKQGAGGCDNFVEFILQHKESLLSQLKDLRSQIVRQATDTIVDISTSVSLNASPKTKQAFCSGFAPDAIEACLKLTIMTKKIMSQVHRSQ